MMMLDECCMNVSMLLRRLCRLPYRQRFKASLLLTVTGILLSSGEQLSSGEHCVLFLVRILNNNIPSTVCVDFM